VSNSGGIKLSVCQSLGLKTKVMWMIDVEEFLTLRDLFNKDLSISEIARQTGHSRVTVRKHLNSQIPLCPRRDPENKAN